MKVSTRISKGWVSFTPQTRLHLPAWQAGCIFGAAGVGGLIGSALALRLYQRGWRQSVIGALCLGAVASLSLAYAGQLSVTAGFVLALCGNLILDGACSFSFVLTGSPQSRC